MKYNKQKLIEALKTNHVLTQKRIIQMRKENAEAFIKHEESMRKTREHYIVQMEAYIEAYKAWDHTASPYRGVSQPIAPYSSFSKPKDENYENGILMEIERAIKNLEFVEDETITITQNSFHNGLRNVFRMLGL
jgi:hypothetical protein